MSSHELEESAASVERVTIDDLPQELLDCIPAACINCSTARLRTYRGHFDRECPGPLASLELDDGQIVPGPICQYPTGAEPKPAE